jgi:hypothetical protein
MSVIAMIRARTESLDTSRRGERARRAGSDMTRIASDTEMVTPVAAAAAGLDS